MINPYAPPQAEAASVMSGNEDRAFDLKFELSEQDVVAYQLHHVRRVASRGFGVVQLGGGVVLLIGVVQSALSRVLQPFVVLGAILLGIGIWLGSRLRLERALRKATATGWRVAAFGHWNLTLDPRGVRYTAPAMRCDYDWRAVELVIEAPEHFLLYLNEAMAIVVPKRAFGSAEQAAAFGLCAKHYLDRDRIARGQPIAPKMRSALRPLLLWLLLIMLFLAIWQLLATLIDGR